MKMVQCTIIVIAIIASSFLPNETQQKTIKVLFFVDGVRKELTKSDRLFFISKSDTLKNEIDNNGYITSKNVLTQNEYSVIFIHSKDTLVFNGIEAIMITPDQNYEWRFGIDNRPFDNTLGLLSYEEFLTDTITSRLEYWQFITIDEGDGIQIVNKITK